MIKQQQTTTNNKQQPQTTMASLISNFGRSLLQNTSKQDACGYVENEKFNVLWVSDSHGGNLDEKKYIIRNFLNNISDEEWISYLDQDNFHIAPEAQKPELKPLEPAPNIFKDIVKLGPFKDTGATFSIVKIFPDRFESYRVGDSPIFIWRDGELIHHSTHDEELEEDIKILKKRTNFRNGNGIFNTQDIEPLSPTTMRMKPAYYVQWDSGNRMNMTRSIGHNDTYLKRTHSLPCWTMTKHIIERIEGSKEKVMIATDGITGVCGAFDFPTFYSSSAESILQMALGRWKQSWIFKSPNICDTRETLPDYNRDDMALVNWQTP